MNRTYGLFFFIVKNTMFILNVIIVLFYVAVIAITTKYIIGNDLARSFLDKVMYMPTAPVYIISGSVGLLLCLAYCVYYREFNNIRNKTINYQWTVLQCRLGALLPSVGVAILLKQVVNDVMDFIPFFLGFALAAGLGLNLIGAAIVGGMFAIINYKIQMLRIEAKKAAASGVTSYDDDDEEDI